jgi:aminopeptidase N
VQALTKAYRSLEHPKARRALIAALGSVKSAEANALLRAGYQREKSYFAETQALRSLAQSGDPSLPKILAQALKRPSWNEVLRAGALEAVAALRGDDAFSVLSRYTAWGHPQPLRMAAVRGLGQLGAGREDVRRHLLALLEDPFLLVQLAAVRALMQVGDERAVPALKKLTEGDRDGRLKRTAEEAVLQLKKGIEDETSSKK